MMALAPNRFLYLLVWLGYVSVLQMSLIFYPSGSMVIYMYIRYRIRSIWRKEPNGRFSSLIIIPYSVRALAYVR